MRLVFLKRKELLKDGLANSNDLYKTNVLFNKTITVGFLLLNNNLLARSLGFVFFFLRKRHQLGV